MDRGTIRTEVQRQVNEPAADGAWSNTDYDNVINRAQDDFAIRTKCLKTCATFSTTADTAEYDIGDSSLANFLDISEIWFFTSTTTYTVLTRVSRDELSRLQGEVEGTDGYPQFFCYEDRVITFECDPPASKSVRVWYYKLPTAMDEDADVSDIPVKFHGALVNYVCWKFTESDDLDAERAMYFKQQYFEDVSKALMVLRPAGSTYGGIKDDTEIPYYG